MCPIFQAGLKFHQIESFSLTFQMAFNMSI
jgi:hypothetical protein